MLLLFALHEKYKNTFKNMKTVDLVNIMETSLKRNIYYASEYKW